jgi:hypothetical protein
MALRNIIVLTAFEFREPELAAEIGLHMMHSAFLTPSLWHEFRKVCILVLPPDDILPGRKIRFAKDFARGAVAHSICLSKYGLETARKNMEDVMSNPSRVDYWERHLANLKPAHRLAFAHFRETGVLASFGADTSGFIIPNRYVIPRRDPPRKLINPSGFSSVPMAENV